MMATGIVRRIDDLGRVVIPKEIRRRFGIREGDPLEIFLTEDSIMFRRYHHSLIADIDALRLVLNEHYNYDYEHSEEKKQISKLLNEVKEIVKKIEEE